MVSKKINKISNQVDAFYLLIKKAVPLDEVIFTPNSDYYNPNDPGFISPRKSKKGEMDLPPIQEFKSHFKNTNIKYRIIYSNETFGASSNNPVNIDKYKRSLQWAIEQGKNAYKKYSHQDMEDAKYLLDNADTIFNPQAINIIVNKYNSNDLTGPKGIDHDLGHIILNQYVIDFKSENMLKAIQKDYKIIADGSSGSEIKTDFKEASFVLLTAIIAINNPIPGSISEMNIKNKNLSDLFYDLMITYNLQGQSLKDINLNGITIYSNKEVKKFSLEPSEEINVRLEPKNLNIPNIKEELNKLFIKLEENIQRELNPLVGKVISLWY